MSIDDFLSAAEQQQIVHAIEHAETITSGEIRVHVEPSCIWGDSYERAVEVFNQLGMYHTKQRNGVLIYIAFNSHHLAIIGDSGINDLVGQHFWDEEIAMLKQYFIDNIPTLGICKVIDSIGKKLSEYFPPVDNDINEQPNEISFTADGEAK